MVRGYVSWESFNFSKESMMNGEIQVGAIKPRHSVLGRMPLQMEFAFNRGVGATVENVKRIRALKRTTRIVTTKGAEGGQALQFSF